MTPKNLLHSTLAAWLLIFTVALPSFAKEQKNDFSSFSLTVEQWQSKADASWQISFNSGAGKTESELDYDDINSTILFLKARYNPLENISLEANVGLGGIDNAQYTDIDRTNGAVWSESKGDVDGRVVQWGADLYVHVLPADSQSILDVFIGYEHYEDKLRMFNGNQTVSDPAAAPSSISPLPLGPFSGLNANYDFEWNYVRMGAELGYNFVANPKPALHSFGLKASLGAIPYVYYKGTGVWNLRSDLAQNPSFRHESISGLGLETSLALTYSPHELVQVVAGYRYLNLQARNGTDRTYGSDGSTGKANLDKVNLIRQGPFFVLTVMF